MDGTVTSMSEEMFVWSGAPSQAVGTESAFCVLASAIAERGVLPRRIVELGTGIGGLTKWIRGAADAWGWTASVTTYDIVRQGKVEELLALGITFIEADIFAAEAEIGCMIGCDGMTLLLCDDGDKPREVRTFAKYLKAGDVIMAHDYCPSLEQYKREHRWVCACEIVDAEVADVISEYSLVPFVQDAMAAVAWMSKIRAVGCDEKLSAGIGTT